MDEPDIGKRLSAAVNKGKLADVKKLLHGHGVTGLPDGGFTLLCKAVEQKQFAIAKLLITSGVAVTRTSPVRDNSPLRWACTFGNLDLVQLLLDRDAGVSAAGVDGQTPLHCAVEHRHVAVTKLLLERNADPSVGDNRHQTPLLAAAGKGCALIVELLLKYEVDVNIAGSEGMTSLHLAAECGSWHVTKLLLAKGASFNAKNDINQTPLHVAAHKGHLTIVEMLVEAGASVSCVCSSHFTPLHYASASGIPEIVEFLLKNGAEIEQKASYPSDFLSRYQSLSFSRMYSGVGKKFYGHSSIPHVPLNKKYTPLHIASKLGHNKVIELLLDRGADVKAKTADGTTPLLIAIRRRLASVMRLLLQKGSQVDDVDASGKTVLQVAIETGSLMIVQEILNHKPNINNKGNKSCIKALVLSINNQVRLSRETVKHPTLNHPYMQENNFYGGEQEAGNILKALLNNGFSINDEDANDSNFLRAAVNRGFLQVVEDLVMKGAQVNSCGNQNSYFSLLHRAVQDKNVKMAELLIRLKADVNAKSKDGKTPIFFTFTNHVSTKRTIKNLSHGQKDLVELLIKSGSDLNIQDSDKKAVLFHAVENNNQEMVRLLIANNADVNVKDGTGKTPIFYASNFKMSELLLKNNADLNIRDDSGKTLIFSAIELSNFEMIKFLIKNTEHLNSKDSNGKTPIFYAVQKSDFYVINNMVKKNAILNGENKNGITPEMYYSMSMNVRFTQLLYNNETSMNKFPKHLMGASERKCKVIVQLLIEHGADVNEVDKYGKTALHNVLCGLFSKNLIGHFSQEFLASSDYDASGNERGEIANLLLGGGANVDAQTNDGSRALHFAARAGWVQPVKVLLQFNADVNCVASIDHRHDVTPLHLCAHQGNVEICAMLLKVGAHVDAERSDGQTALHIACENGMADIVKLLLESKADVNAKLTDGNTPLHISCKNENADIVKVLLENKADVNAKLTDGMTALHISCENDNADILKVLLENNAEVNAVLTSGRTALHIACDIESMDIVKVLLENKADVNSLLFGGRTPLHIACESRRADIVKVLLDRGANVNAKQADGLTPLHCASAHCNAGIVKALLMYGADVNDQLARGGTALQRASISSGSFEAILDYGGDIDAEVRLMDYCMHLAESRQVLKRHVFKLNVANMHVPQHYLQCLSSTEFGEPPVNSADNRFNCEEELARMMSEQIENTSVSFHDILTKNSNTLGKFVRNEDIMSAVKSSRCRTKFPVYVGLMLRQIHRGVARMNLLERATQVLELLFPQLPLVCVEKVLNYLSSSELKVMVDDLSF